MIILPIVCEYLSVPAGLQPIDPELILLQHGLVCGATHQLASEMSVLDPSMAAALVVLEAGAVLVFWDC